MAELQRTRNPAIDISAARTVLTYTYSGSQPLEAVARVDLGSIGAPIAGGGLYKLSVFLNDVVVSPDAEVTIGAVTRTTMMSRSLALDTDDVVTVKALGLPADTSVEVVASLRDVTPASLSDIVGAGPVLVDHNYGGTDNLTYLSPGGLGIASAEIQVFLQSDYAAGHADNAHLVARTNTDVRGHWGRALSLEPGSYTIVFSAYGRFGPDSRDVTVS